MRLFTANIQVFDREEFRGIGPNSSIFGSVRGALLSFNALLHVGRAHSKSNITYRGQHDHKTDAETRGKW